LLVKRGNIKKGGKDDLSNALRIKEAFIRYAVKVNFVNEERRKT